MKYGVHQLPNVNAWGSCTCRKGQSEFRDGEDVGGVKFLLSFLSFYQ